jgi:hypothetical protein
MLLGLIACQKNTETSPEDSHYLVATNTWQCKELVLKGGTKTAAYYTKGAAINTIDYSAVRYQFMKNSSYEGIRYDGKSGTKETGTWAISKDGVYLDIVASGYIYSYKIVRINANAVELSQTLNADNFPQYAALLQQMVATQGFDTKLTSMELVLRLVPS